MSKIETCSIFNARSGKCSEDCQWCAQSKFSKCDVDSYPIAEHKKMVDEGLLNDSLKIDRYSLVTSGRSLSLKYTKEICSVYRELKENSNLKLCASCGLMDRERLSMLYDAGVSRYHCNIETSPRMFPKLVSSHTMKDKIETIKIAQSLGMSVCSGGIIGMGETMNDRKEMANILYDLQVDSIPLNLLMRIKGTPLVENSSLAGVFTDDELLETFQMFIETNPQAKVRLCAGRARVQHLLPKLFDMGLKAIMTGNFLTIKGFSKKEDMKMLLSM